jgi:DNA-directed RNA polymerase subunit H (RpoH/RPB5)
MVRDRGFVKITNVSPSPQNVHCVLKGRKLSSQETCYVHVVQETKLGIKTLRAIMNRYKETQPPPKVIVVCQEGATSFTTKSISDGGMGNDVCVFKASEVTKNITRHKYVPKHRRCNQDEVSELLERLSLSSVEPLPKLSAKDPVSRYYKFAPGEVVSIKRESHAHEPHEYYRVVTKD